MLVRLICVVLLLGLSASIASGQGSLGSTDAQAGTTVAPNATFDVATIKLSDPNAPGGGIGWRPNGSFYTKGQTLKNIVCGAYDEMTFQCVGGPAWFGSDKYDIEAKPDSATEERLQKIDQRETWPFERQMQQALFADRLKLKVHYETREMPIFALVVAKGGLKMQAVATDDKAENTARSLMTVGNGKMRARSISMDSLAEQLQASISHVVTNKTGLAGDYDFTLQYSNSDLPAPDSSAPSIYTAIEEQLGLKLEATKGPVRVLVIDHVERPSDN